MKRRQHGRLSFERFRADPALTNVHWPDDVLRDVLFEHGDHGPFVKDSGYLDLSVCASVAAAVRLGALGLRRSAGSMATRRPYPSYLSDARWELVEPVLAAWRVERRGRALDFGRPPGHDLRGSVARKSRAAEVTRSRMCCWSGG